MVHRFQSRAFSLIEMIAIIAVVLSLMALLTPSLRYSFERVSEYKALNNLRQVGLATLRFVSDNGGELPVLTVEGRQWPSRIVEYLGNDPRYFAEPSSKVNYITMKVNPTSNTANNTSYVLNAFDDLGSDKIINIINIERLSDTVLMAAQGYHPENFVLNVNSGDHRSMIDYRKYRGGAQYLLADGSARYISASEFRSSLWLADKSITLK